MNVLITGAAGGLGRAMAVECAGRGYNLFLTDLNGGSLRLIKEGLERRFGGRVSTEVCDLTDSGAVDRMFERWGGEGICFDMLLNIAGIDFEGSFMQRDHQPPRTGRAQDSRPRAPRQGALHSRSCEPHARSRRKGCTAGGRRLGHLPPLARLSAALA